MHSFHEQEICENRKKISLRKFLMHFVCYSLFWNNFGRYSNALKLFLRQL